jgi:hypothetical protein
MDMPQSTTEMITTLVGGGAAGGVAKTLFDYFLGRARSKAEVGKLEADAEVQLQDIIDRRVKMILERDEKAIEKLEAQVNRWQNYTRVLIAILQKSGITVPPEPE